MPVETMRVSVRVRLCVVMEGAQLVPLAQSRGPFSPSRITWRLSCGLGYAARHRAQQAKAMCVESCEALPRPMASHNSQKGVFFAKRAPLPCLVARLSTWRGVTWCGGGPWFHGRAPPPPPTPRALDRKGKCGPHISPVEMGGAAVPGRGAYIVHNEVL